MNPRNPSRRLLPALSLVALVMGLHAVVMTSAGLELHYEEAQYWLWSTRLDWSYYSKGPLVAWLIAAATAALGHGEAQVRLFAWLAHGLFLLAVYGFARDLWGRRDAALWAVALAAVTPVHFLLGGVMTTDVFLFLFWTLGLWAAHRALVGQRPRAWYAMGGAVGVGALGKLSIGLLPAATALVMLLRPAWRHHYRAPQPWLAALLALLLMAPMVGWNAAHDWVMVRHEGGHVAAGGFDGHGLAEFVGGQFIALSPLLLATLVAVLWRPPAAPGAQLVWLVSAGVLAFFVVKAMTGKVQANWPAMAYIGALVLLAGEAVRRGPRFRAWLGVVMAAAVVQSLAILYLPLTGAFAARDPLKALRGWQAPIAALAAHTAGADFLLTRNYHLASRLAFYLPGELPAYIGGDAGRRHNQFDLWPGPGRHRGGTALYVAGEDRLPVAIEEAFTGGCATLPPVPAADPRLYAWRCHGFEGETWAPPSGY